ncbi:aminoacyl-tRNA hydrolase [bacterium]|nr:aminoacyl-tRNA hydrolase [bacterium]
MRTKQVLIVRKDLKMRKGKIGAQCAHASLAILTNNLIGFPFKWYLFPYYLAKFVFLFLTHKALRSWLTTRFTKICVYVDSEQDLLLLYNKAKSAGLLCSLIKDAGLTEFGGVPTYTVVAIGPDVDEKINEITGGLPLL